MERLQRILSARGIASRRVAEEMILAGRVSVNGESVTELGAKADPDSDVIRVDGKVVKPQRRRYVMLNKPSGYITTTSDERNRRTVMDLVNTRERLYPIGRLDRETEGLLLLTNDGELANRVMHPRFGLEKEYHIYTPERPDVRVIERVRRGIEIEGKRVVPNEFRLLRETRDGAVLTIALHEGMYHVVRRMMDFAGIPVDKLTRVRVGPLSIAGLPIGFWRDLRTGEEQTLFEAVHMDLPEDDAVVRRDREIDWEREWSQKRQEEFSPTPGRAPKPSRSEQRPRDRRDFQPRDGQRQGDRRDFQPRDGQAQQERRGPRRFDPKKDSWQTGQPAERPARDADQRPQRRPERPNRDFNPRDRDERTPQKSFDHKGRPVRDRDQDRKTSPRPTRGGGEQDRTRDSGNSRRDRGENRKNERNAPARHDESRGVAPRNDRSKPRPPQGDRDRRPGRSGEDNGSPRSGA